MPREPKLPREFFPPEVDCPFVGRSEEIEWLDRELDSREHYHGDQIVVVGEPGIGKTTLASGFAGRLGERRMPLWIPCRDISQRSDIIERAMQFIRDDRSRGEIVAVFDGADEIPREALMGEFHRVTNYKRVRSVIFTSRTELGIRGERILRLGRLAEPDAESLIKGSLDAASLDRGTLAKILAAVHGHPLAIRLVAAMAGSMDPEQLRRVLAGHLYDLKDTSAGKALISAAKPIIISANDAMIRALKKQPADVFKLTSREYEELVAELLNDMGYDVTLTPATRDGGKDILASFKTDCGEFLCLVEAKHYRQDRKIGVSLVRELYGTLCDYQANSGMLVTTSSYSKDARALQQKHKYLLSLHDYTDVAGWIQKYGTKK
jgi:restriction system protein